MTNSYEVTIFWYIMYQTTAARNKPQIVYFTEDSTSTNK